MLAQPLGHIDKSSKVEAIFLANTGGGACLSAPIDRDYRGEEWRRKCTRNRCLLVASQVIAGEGRVSAYLAVDGGSASLFQVTMEFK